jgi:hypothetical protein
MSVASIVTSTYAWYVLSSTLIASNISINYQNKVFQMGLFVNNEPQYFSDSDGEPKDLDTSLLEEYAGYDPNEKLDAVSGMYQSLWLNDKTVFDTTFPVLRSSYDGAKTDYLESTPASSGFLQFDCCFTSDQDTYVFLDSSTSLAAAHDTNAIIAAKSGYSVSDLDKVANAMRISFYSDLGYLIYEPNVTSPSMTAFAGKLNVRGSDGYYDFDNAGKEVLYGDYNKNGASLIYDTQSRVTSLSAPATAFNALTSPDAQSLNLARSLSEGNLIIQHEVTHTLSELTNQDETKYPIVYIPADQNKRVVISIYLEGWDRDMVDSIGNAHFNLNLCFTGILKHQII